MLKRNDAFQSSLNDDRLFDMLMQVDGETYRYVKNRATLKIKFRDESYFIKRYQGWDYKEIAKNLLQLKLPVLGALNEVKACKLLEDNGVRTLDIAAYGQRGVGEAFQSFALSRDLNSQVTAEDLLRSGLPFGARRSLLTAVAKTMRRVHRLEILHQDMYLCHFVYVGGEAEPKSFNPEDFAVIDLHRARFGRGKKLVRYKKDLAAMAFALLDSAEHLSQRDIYCFVVSYFGSREKIAVSDDLKRFIINKAEKIYRRDHKTEAPKFYREMRWLNYHE